MLFEMRAISDDVPVAERSDISLAEALSRSV